MQESFNIQEIPSPGRASENQTHPLPMYYTLCTRRPYHPYNDGRYAIPQTCKNTMPSKDSSHSYNPYAFGSTGVGAIRLFLGFPSSFSLSLASRFVPAVADTLLRGVSGGVVIGTPVTLPVLAAATVGTVPPIRGGLLITPLEPAAGCVATDEVELDLAGDAGRCGAADTDAGGDGAVNELFELRCWC